MIVAGSDMVGVGIIDTLGRYLPGMFLVDADGGRTGGSGLSLSGVFIESRLEQTVELGLVFML